MRTITESGLIVTFTNSTKDDVEEFLSHSDYYGECLDDENVIYLFPTSFDTYDSLERELTALFNDNYLYATFEGVETSQIKPIYEQSIDEFYKFG